ncbi:hypothetical protein [Nonomuraea dietziae]|uniref:Uncharacterized protein n=1 Tax=Nonomuraea dietziae TaxID=65515 RepID=A0A7W5VT53_9ACTN|nr:hypothetical protein [Nonomuraea dietziae]MBB3734042.1 hypothetical protein [Nonomuraea dietziae]
MAEDRQVSPWSDDGSQQRGWADQQAGLYLTPDQSLVDDDARSFNRGTALESDRSYRPAPKATLTWTPRRDLIWEPGSQQDLGRLATDDAIQAIMRVQSLVYDLPDSQGPVAGDPRTLGSRWHAADFATVTLDIDGDRRRLFDAKLRSVLNPASISVVSTSQPLRGELRPLPTETKEQILSDINDLATAKVKDLEERTKNGLQETIDAPGVQGYLFRAHVSDTHDLLYHYNSSAWPAARASNEKPDGTAYSQGRRPEVPVGRPAIHLLGIVDAEMPAAEVRDLVRQRTQSQVPGRVLYRVLGADQSPTGRPAVQVLAISDTPLSEEAVRERVTALAERTAEHQLATGADKPLPYTAPLHNAAGMVRAGAVIKPVIGNSASHRRTNGLAPLPSRRPARPEPRVLADFEQAVATSLPSTREFELRFTPAAMQEFTSLPPGRFKLAVKNELVSLATAGPQPGDKRRQPPADAPPPMPGSVAAAREHDLTGLRPRYLTPGEGQPPTHQIIYAIVRNPLAPRDGGHVQPYAPGEEIVPQYEGYEAAGRTEPVSKDTPPKAGPRLAARDLSDYRPTLLVAGILPWPEPRAEEIIASRLPRRAHVHRAQLTGNRGLTAVLPTRPKDQSETLSKKTTALVQTAEGPLRLPAQLSGERRGGDRVELQVGERFLRLTIDDLEAGLTQGRDLPAAGLRIRPARSSTVQFEFVEQGQARTFLLQRKPIQEFLTALRHHDKEGDQQRAERLHDEVDQQLKDAQQPGQVVAANAEVFVRTSNGSRSHTGQLISHPTEKGDDLKLSIRNGPVLDLGQDLQALQAALDKPVIVPDAGLRMAPSPEGAWILFEMRTDAGRAVDFAIRRPTVESFLIDAQSVRDTLTTAPSRPPRTQRRCSTEPAPDALRTELLVRQSPTASGQDDLTRLHLSWEKSQPTLVNLNLEMHEGTIQAPTAKLAASLQSPVEVDGLRLQPSGDTIIAAWPGQATSYHIPRDTLSRFLDDLSGRRPAVPAPHERRPVQDRARVGKQRAATLRSSTSKDAPLPKQTSSSAEPAVRRTGEPTRVRTPVRS